MMNNLRIALLAAVAALSLTACLDDAAPAGDDDTIVDMGKVDGSTTDEAPSVTEHGRQEDVCLQLPHDGTACAFACDPDALIDFIPEGTCVSFICTLTNGQSFVTGGCNL